MTSVEFAKAWTRKLEALGVVLNNGIVPTSSARFLEGPLHPHPKRGRKLRHESNALRQRAYRDRRRSRVLQNRRGTSEF